MLGSVRIDLCCLALASSLWATGVARAQDVDPSTRAAARTLGYSGVEAFQHGDYPAASDKLEKAFKTLQIPALGLWSARAKEKLGQLVEAAERYREVGALKSTAGEEDVQRKAMEDAATELKALQPRIPTLVVQVEGAPSSGVTVTIDTRTLPAALIGEVVPVNPGAHRITARDGGRAAEQSISLRESEQRRVLLRFDAAAGASNAPTPPSPEPPRASTDARPPDVAATPSGSLQRTLGWITVGVGGAALVTGAVTGVLAIGKRGSLDGPNCHLDDNVCLKTQQDEVDSYNGLRHVSTFGFVAGGILAATGAVLLFTAPKSERQVTLRIAPQGVALQAQF